MDIESDETDNDDHLSFGNDSSTDDNDRKNPFSEQMKKSSNTRKKNLAIPFSFFHHSRLESDPLYKYVQWTFSSQMPFNILFA